MIRIVKMKFMPEHIQDFENLFESRKEKIRNFEGCVYLELWQDKSDKSIFYTYSLWSDSSFLESYRKSELFEDTWSTVKKWFSEKPHAFSATKLIHLP